MFTAFKGAWWVGGGRQEQMETSFTHYGIVLQICWVSKQFLFLEFRRGKDYSEGTKGKILGEMAPCLLARSTYTVIVQWMSTVWVGETGAQGVCLGLRNHAEIREEWERILRVGPRASKRVVRSHFQKTDWKCLQRIWNTRLRSGFYSQKLKYQQRCYSREYSGGGVLGKLISI